MKHTLRDIVITLVLSAALFIAAIYSYSFLYDIFIPSPEGTIFHVTTFETPFQRGLLFACILGAIPILCYFLWHMMPLQGTAKRLMSLGLIIVAMLLAIFIRRYTFQNDLNEQTANAEKYHINPGISGSFSQLNIEYWLAVGIVAGVLLTFVFLRNKKKR